MATSPAAFWPEALPWAQEAHDQTGVLTSVILAQWAIETAYGGPDWLPPRNNPGNVGNTQEAGQEDYPTLAAGVAGYIACMLLDYYTDVRSASGYVAQSLALGESPWAGAHYALPGGGPGSELIYVVETYDLTQYDAAAPVPIPPAPTTQESVYMIPSGCTDHGAINAQIREWWAFLRSMPMTAEDQSVLLYCFYVPAANGGFSQDPDALLANIIDAGTASGTLRPMWSNAV